MIFAKNIICFVLLFLCFTTAFSQKQKITGKVTDEAGIPIPGASIQLKSTGKVTTTTTEGNFTMDVDIKTAVFEISSIGFAPASIKVNGQTDLSIKLKASTQDLSQIVMVGSRHAGRIKTDSPVPVDIINVASANVSTAKPDLTSILNYAAPSFNYNKQSGGDGADQIDLATLRGLGPDQTLVLINGKRRHQTAFVALFGTRGRGNSGTDLNAIPEASIDRVEILRDGASAQYGSDAIAGVINLILKKDVHQLTVNAGYSGYYDSKYNSYFGRNLNQYVHGGPVDGKTFSFDLNDGIALGKTKKGFLNYSISFLNQGKTYRQDNDTNLTHTNGLPINAVRRANGDASSTGGGIMLNMEAPIKNSSSTFYAFGGYNLKESDAYAYTRTFHAFNPLASPHADRFPTDANGNLIFNPSIMQSIPTPGNIPDTVFNPHEQTHISDASIAVGLKGTSKSAWDWDLSNTLGKNNFHYFGDKHKTSFR